MFGINGSTAEPNIGSEMLIDDLSFSGTATSVQADENIRQQNAGGFSLAQSYPNPFNSECVIEYAVPEPSDVSIVVYDACGREVATVFRGTAVPGRHSAHFQPAGLQSGLYFFRMTAASRTGARVFNGMQKTMYLK